MLAAFFYLNSLINETRKHKKHDIREKYNCANKYPNGKKAIKFFSKAL